MNIQEQISEYINSQPEPKGSDMQQLHKLMLLKLPNCKLWFDDGKKSENKTISNPIIGYGHQDMQMEKPDNFFKLG